MLDAYERITLEPNARGLFRTTFMVPDTYGIFKFRVHYRRPGYTVLSFSTQASEGCCFSSEAGRRFLEHLDVPCELGCGGWRGASSRACS